jgi:hypothetical protein
MDFVFYKASDKNAIALFHYSMLSVLHGKIHKRLMNDIP